MTARTQLTWLLCSLALAACDTPAPLDGGAMDASVDGGAEVTPCEANRDCDDGLYCNGLERCEPGGAGADPVGCVGGEPPCASELCDAEARACRCGDEPDADDDGHDSLACGGDDCDDTDPNRYPGNTEVCDAEGHDEDCSDATLGDRDRDGDGFVDAACCNGDACGSDCNDARRDVHPDATEACNTIDDDCDGVVDGAEAFCPAGLCQLNRCRANGWERVFAPGGGAAPSVTTDAAGNAYAVFGAEFRSIDVRGQDRWTAVAPPDVRSIVLSEAQNRVIVVGRESFASFDATTGEGRGEVVIDRGEDWSFVETSHAVWYDDSLYLTERLRYPQPGTSTDRGVRVRRIDASGAEVASLLLDMTWSTFEYDADYPIDASAGGVVLTSRCLLNGGADELVVGSDEDGAPVNLQHADNFVLVLDHMLNARWVVGGLPNGLETSYAASAVAISDEGAVAVAGGCAECFSAWDDFDVGKGQYVIAFAADRSHLWSWNHVHENFDVENFFTSVGFDGRGGVLATGFFTGQLVTPIFSPTANGQDGIGLLFDVASGAVLDLWHVAAASARIQGVALDRFGNFVFVGNFSRNLVLPSGSVFNPDGPGGSFAFRIADEF